MPIRKDLRPFYGPEWKKEIRPRILLRAENKCENCGAPNHVEVLRAAGWWTPFVHDNHSPSLSLFIRKRPAELFWTPPGGAPGHVAGFPPEIVRLVRIVLCVCHVNHTSGDDRDENLKAWCQWCHLNHDKEQHHETRATRKDARRPLLAICQSSKDSIAL
jgi:hypothetical protein